MVICPLMTSGTTGVNCLEARCAFWDSLYGRCIYASHAERLSAALEKIMSILTDIKGRL